MNRMDLDVRELLNFVAINCHAEHFIRCEIECDFDACIDTQSIVNTLNALLFGNRPAEKIRFRTNKDSLQIFKFTIDVKLHIKHRLRIQTEKNRLQEFTRVVCMLVRLCRLTRCA